MRARLAGLLRSLADRLHPPAPARPTWNPGNRVAYDPALYLIPTKEEYWT